MADGAYSIFKAELARVRAASGANHSVAGLQAELTHFVSDYALDLGLGAFSALGKGIVPFAMSWLSRRQVRERVDELVPVFISALEGRRRGPHAARTVAFDLAVVAAAEAGVCTGLGMTDLQAVSVGNGARVLLRWARSGQSFGEVIVTESMTRSDRETTGYFKTLLGAYIVNAARSELVTPTVAGELLREFHVLETAEIGSLRCDVSRHPFRGRRMIELFAPERVEATASIVRRRYPRSHHGIDIFEEGLQVSLDPANSVALHRLSTSLADSISEMVPTTTE